MSCVYDIELSQNFSSYQKESLGGPLVRKVENKHKNENI